VTSSDLRRVQSTWDALAQDQDLFCVIVGFPFRRDQSEKRFFASGAREIRRTLRREAFRRLPRRHETALDFGCGAGRLTQAMATRFEHVVGVDIAPTMIEAARALNRQPDRCEYVLNEEESLGRFADRSFDFVYSNIVLQHMPPELGRGYVAELARVLREGGLLVFQVPDAREPLPRLPRSAVLAEIEPQQTRIGIPAGATARMPVVVRNRSGKPWWVVSGEPTQRIFLGNHWRDRQGTLLVQDDGRAELPFDVPPGGEAQIDLEVTAPGERGRYLLELDLVQQDVAWFSERRKLSRRRTRTALVEVDVGDTFEPPLLHPEGVASDGPEEGPRMEMHAIPRSSVLETLDAGGVVVLRVKRDDASGPGWRSLRYTATRR
jgi:SAM-dependent methyltransferase